MTVTLTDFLLAQIAEDEAATLTMVCECVDDPGPGCPSRVLAECEAKRAIVELHAPEPGQHPDFCGHDLRQLPCSTLRILALPYADHPDFDPAWRP